MQVITLQRTSRAQSGRRLAHLPSGQPDRATRQVTLLVTSCESPYRDSVTGNNGTGKNNWAGIENGPTVDLIERYTAAGKIGVEEWREWSR